MARNLLENNQTQSEGRNLLASAKPSVPQQSVNYNPALQTARGGLQGATFGWSDELGGAIAALAGSIKTGESFSDAYDKIHQQLQSKREQFSKDSPGLALGAEIAGGLATGGVGGGKLLGGKAFEAASNLGKAGRLAGVGAGQGAIYGTGAADQGKRIEGGLTGAGMGAVMAPVGAGVANAAGRAIGSGTNYVTAKLGETARNKAERILRETAEASGFTGEQIADKMDDLGRQSILADVNDSFRVVARAGMNRIGTMRDAGTSKVAARQKGQQDRLLREIESVAGDSSSYGKTISQVIKNRAKAAAPVYQRAFNAGVRMTDDLQGLIDNSVLKPMFKKAQRLAGDDGTENLLNVLHIMKSEVLDDAISSSLSIANRKPANARRLVRLKQELLDEIGKQNPDYLEANKIFSNHSRLKNALELGRKLLKTDPEQLDDIVADMTDVELEMFRLGGVKSISKMLDNVADNRDSTRRLLQSRDMRDKLSFVLGDDADAFLKQAGIEEQFTQTRNMLTGNSTTELQQQASRSLDDAVDPGMATAIANANPAALVANVIDGLTKGRATPEVIDELGKIMFNNKLTRDEILRIFNQPRIRQMLGDRYGEVVAPVVRGAAAPTAQAVANQ